MNEKTFTAEERKIENFGKELMTSKNRAPFPEQQFSLTYILKNEEKGDMAFYEGKTFNIPAYANQFKEEKEFPQTIKAACDGTRIALK